MAEIDDAERERRSELAKRLNQEVVVDPLTGVERKKFGGPQPNSGRPRKDRANTLVAEAARNQENAKAMVEALKKGVTSNDPAIAVRATEAWLKIERQEDELAMKEERDYTKMRRDDLMALLAEKMLGMQERGVAIPAFDIEEAEYTELEA